MARETGLAAMALVPRWIQPEPTARLSTKPAGYPKAYHGRFVNSKLRTRRCGGPSVTPWTHSIQSDVSVTMLGDKPFDKIKQLRKVEQEIATYAYVNGEAVRRVDGVTAIRELNEDIKAHRHDVRGSQPAVDRVDDGVADWQKSSMLLCNCSRTRGYESSAQPCAQDLHKMARLAGASAHWIEKAGISQSRARAINPSAEAVDIPL